MSAHRPHQSAVEETNRDSDRQSAHSPVPARSHCDRSSSDTVSAPAPPPPPKAFPPQPAPPIPSRETRAVKPNPSLRRSSCSLKNKNIPQCTPLRNSWKDSPEAAKAASRE